MQTERNIHVGFASVIVAASILANVEAKPVYIARAGFKSFEILTKRPYNRERVAKIEPGFNASETAQETFTVAQTMSANAEGKPVYVVVEGKRAFRAVEKPSEGQRIVGVVTFTRQARDESAETVTEKPVTVPVSAEGPTIYKGRGRPCKTDVRPVPMFSA